MDPSRCTGREHSQLFLVRLWTEEDLATSNGEHDESGEDKGKDGQGHIEWCGKLQDVVSGEAQYFRGWPMLTQLLLEMAVAGGGLLEPGALGTGALESDSGEVSH